MICIGSGPGSLACAATMAKLGWKCAVFEQGEQLGGGAHVFPEKGFEFETGVHYLGNEDEMTKMLDFLTSGRLKLAPIGTAVNGHMKPDSRPPSSNGSNGTTTNVMYDNIVCNGQAYNFLAGKANLLSMLRERFTTPTEQKQLEKFEALLNFHTSKPYKQTAVMFFRLKVPDILEWWPLRPLRTLLQTKLMGRHYYNSTQVSIEEMLTQQCGIEIGSELMAVLLGQYGDSGMRPDKCSAMMHMGIMAHYSEGAVYPVGGSGEIPRKLNAVVLAGGGKSFTQATVESLLMEGRTCIGVRVNGIDVKAKIVVSGIGAYRSYEKLVKPLSDPYLSRCATRAMERIEKTTELTVAFIFLFIGLDISGQPEEERDIRSHNTWIYPGLDHTAMEKRIEEGEPWSEPMPMFVASGSAKDAKWEKTFGTGKKTIVVLSQCPYKWVQKWEDMEHNAREKDAGYQDFKKRERRR